MLYSIVVPLTQGGDELAHYRYIKFIAETGRLPVDFTEREQAWYRSDWPPLYHLLVGWAVSPLDTTQPVLKDVGESPHRRLVGQIFYPRLIIYTEDVTWPWQDGILAWHLGRFISILFSTGALVFTYLTGLELFGRAKDPALLQLRPPVRRLPVALAATALLAFTPRFMFTSAMLGDDSLLILLSAVFIWLLLLRALRGNDAWWLYAVLGLLLGLSITTKYSTGLFVLLIVPVAWWRARQNRWRWWQPVGRVAVSWIFVILGASWWFGWTGFYFNTTETDGPFIGWLNAWLNTGPDVSMRRIFSFFSGESFSGLERPAAIEAGSWWDWSVYLFQTFWSELVLEVDPVFPWAYLLMLVFCGLVLIGLWHLYRRANSQTRMTLVMLALTIVLLFPFPLLRFFLTHNVLETGQGRHILYPAAQSIPILLTLGWTMFSVLTVSRFKIQRLLYVSPFIILLVWSIGLLIYMAQTYPDPLPVQTTTFDPKSIPNRLDHQFGDEIQLSGYDLSVDREQGLLHLTLFWKALEVVDENYRVRVQLIHSDGQSQRIWLGHPVNGLYPTRAWDAGDVVRDELSIPLAAFPKGSYTVQINLLHEAELVPLTPEPLTLTSFEISAPLSLQNANRLGNVDYRLWLDDAPLRHRQAILLSWHRDEPSTTSFLDWALLGPDNVPRRPAVVGEGYANFIVGPDWPGGAYRLQFENNKEALQTESVLRVANELRQFALTPLPEGFVPVEAVFANAEGQPQVKLLGYTLPTRRFEPGGGIPLALYWQSMAPVLEDTVTFAVLLDQTLEPYGSIDRYPSGFYSPILWAEGEVVVDEFTLPIQPEAGNGIYTIRVGQYRRVNGQTESLPLLHNGQLTGETAVVIGPLKIGGPPPEVVTDDPHPQIVLNQTLGDRITLLGYDLSFTANTLEIILYWQAETDLNTDYTTFLHLRDAANQNVAQQDNPPAGGRYPTGLWDKGEIVVDTITLPLEGVPAGPYTPVVGLYDFATGVRLPVPGNPANEMALEPVVVSE